MTKDEVNKSLDAIVEDLKNTSVTVNINECLSDSFLRELLTSMMR